MARLICSPPSPASALAQEEQSHGVEVMLTIALVVLVAIDECHFDAIVKEPTKNVKAVPFDKVSRV